MGSCSSDVHLAIRYFSLDMVATSARKSRLAIFGPGGGLFEGIQNFNGSSYSSHKSETPYTFQDVSKDSLL